MMSLYLLDTTTLTHLKNGLIRVVANHATHCAPTSSDVVGVSSINVEEVIGGWLAYLQRARTTYQEVNGSQNLNDAILALSQFSLYSVTDASITRYEAFRRMKRNVGRNDLRLAALALELGAIVVTDNVRDFGRVPGLQHVDWTK